MFKLKPINGAIRVVKAILTNQVARFAPDLYIRLTGQTGRGSEPETAKEVAVYFRQCFDDYFQRIGVEKEHISAWLAGKRLLEYGPGDVPGVGLLMLAHGADKVICVDRFRLSQPNQKQVAILQALLEELDDDARRRAAGCFEKENEPQSGLRRDRLDYLVTANGLSGLENEIDLIYSRAVLEHVNDLDATFADMARALRPGAIAIHEVDLKSHGLHRDNPLDFLTWPVWLWDLMYSEKGVPNRWRIDRYRQAIDQVGLKAKLLEPTMLANTGDIKEVRPHLATPFRHLEDDALAWLSFWLVAQK
ncbi:MAG: class I SAM-dependent methyltransferase [Lamprobacter sp.]|uniref:class I SAM-dependent methyltransferase n=1 Tax=Lamprobacter sp. TaxID=3100796 RepID=UPI002B25B03D|nr:class I SAM-dependent methyltransferase [Lamprobacter sp.]MEA3643036.1 class I SAM-dependent methyltransferase [Lamprobacter sp.]